MNEKNKKLVMFDFDGVLINTIDLSFDLHKKHNPEFTREKFDSFVEGNFIDGIQEAVKKGHIIPSDWGERYGEFVMKLTINDILHDAVLHLASKYTLAVVSSTLNSFIENYLKKENLFECFSDLCGADVHRSKVYKINSLLSKYSIRPENTVFITDTLGDIKEARECGVKSVAVLWGQHGRASLEKGNPHKIIDDPRDLIPSIEDVLK